MSVSTVRAVALTDRLYALYDMAVERPAVAGPFARLMWGADVRIFYGAHRAVAEAADGDTVLDVPCGGGVAFRALHRRTSLRYLAVDRDPRMLDRARAEARRHGLEGTIEFLEADVTALPVADASVDLCLTSAGLHCFADPAAAVGEMARCLRGGGRLAGTAALRGRGARQDGLIALYRRLGIFGPGGTETDLQHWLEGAGLHQLDLELSGAIARFDARRPPG